MAFRKALLIAAASMTIVVGGLLPVTAGPNNHVVGETDGWKLGVDYDNWASVNAGIPVGDTLEFIYDPDSYNVVMVDEESFKWCIAPQSSPYMWDTGDDILQFEVPGKFFFIDGLGDNCYRGVKLNITFI